MAASHQASKKLHLRGKGGGIQAESALLLLHVSLGFVCLILETGACRGLASDVVFLAGSESAFAAAKADGSVVTWGDTNNGGDQGTASSQLSGVVSLASTLSGFAALKADVRSSTK